jgi:hypothetical protein
MLLNTIDALENKLENFSSNILKNMLCIHTDIFNKLDLIINDLSASASHSSDSESDSIVIKHVIVEASLFLLVIIVGRFVILDKIVIC